MQDFEKDFQKAFPRILKRTGAFLYFLHPPMRCVGTRGTMPVFTQTGRALFDVSGWTPLTITDLKGFERKVAQTIGIELKDTKQRHPSMRIVGDDGTGSGVKAHQLEALASVHRSGGIARLLWCNGGVVGVLDGEEIAAAFHTYGVSVAVEKMRKTPAKGSRSIPWSMFREIDFVELPEAVLVKPAKKPTIAEEMKAKRVKASKQLEEAEREEAEREDAGSFMSDEEYNKLTPGDLADLDA